jgi:hypothetical protein
MIQDGNVVGFGARGDRSGCGEGIAETGVEALKGCCFWVGLAPVALTSVLLDETKVCRFEVA